MKAHPSILIFGYNYAPEPSGNAPYTTSLAEHLASVGWNVTVVTGIPHYPTWKKQPLSRPSDQSPVKVIRRNHFVPSTPDAKGRALLEASWTVSSLPTALKSRAADVVLGVVPGLSGAALAIAAARRLGAPSVVWIQDLMGQAARQSGVAGGGRVARFVEGIELSLARRADSLIVVGEGFREYFVSHGIAETKIQLSRNWSLLPKPGRSRVEARRHFGLPIEAAIATHSGNMGAKQCLDVVVKAAATSKRTIFVLQGDGSERDRLLGLARGRENIRFLPSLPGTDLADLLGASDVLLLTQRPSVTDMSVPSKLMSYLSSGRPIVASVNGASEVATLIRDLDVATVVEPGNVESIISGIRGALDMAETPCNYPQAHIDVSSLATPQEIERVLREVVAP